jgi:hypothetical protein
MRLAAAMRLTNDSRLVLVAVLTAALGACHSPAGGASREASEAAAAAQSTSAAADGLEISFEIRPGTRDERVPLREVVLRFRNVSTQPVRFYLPRGEAFRSGISALWFQAGEHRFVEPEPEPHGVVIEEEDFPLLDPGEERTFTQSFTLDPIPPGPSTRTQRRPGFEDGETVQVTWAYANDIVRWPAGQPTLDGPTQTLFGGGDIPFIWTGKLVVRADWRVR